jgi:hypothetical protein
MFRYQAVACIPYSFDILMELLVAIWKYKSSNLVSVDVGGVDGYSGRSIICQVFPRRFENSDCSEGWE